MVRTGGGGKWVRWMVRKETKCAQSLLRHPWNVGFFQGSNAKWTSGFMQRINTMTFSLQKSLGGWGWDSAVEHMLSMYNASVQPLMPRRQKNKRMHEEGRRRATLQHARLREVRKEWTSDAAAKMEKRESYQKVDQSERLTTHCRYSSCSRINLSFNRQYK